MLKYLKKYGGVSFDEQPLNDVDRLVFAQMAYVDFPADARRDVPLSEILGRITFEKKEAAAEVRFWFQSKSDRELCALAAAAKRYADVRFHGFFRNTDAGAPFAALSGYGSDITEAETINFLDLLYATMIRSGNDGAQLIAFRGTDNTLKGWKEDFDLAVETEIPTQGTAKKFVEAAAQEERLLELCGHSKGGNLALYAAVFAGAQAQKQLRQAVSFDGPGLSAEVMRSVEYRQAAARRSAGVAGRASVPSAGKRADCAQQHVQRASALSLHMEDRRHGLCRGAQADRARAADRRHRVRTD